MDKSLRESKKHPSGRGGEVALKGPLDTLNYLSVLKQKNYTSCPINTHSATHSN